MNQCVFLDRDGVINTERGTYTWLVEDFEIIQGVKEALRELKKSEFKLIVVTNQAGITRGLFSKIDMEKCHDYLMRETDNLIDDIYYATYHPEFSNSLLRKPDSLMFEKAMAKYDIDPSRSWMIGNHERDLIPAKKLGMHTIYITNQEDIIKADFYTPDLKVAADRILKINKEDQQDNLI